MSQENVEIMRTGLAAWNTGDEERLRDVYDPNAIHKSIEGWPEPGPFVGREAIMEWFRRLRETWDTDAMEPVSFTDAGDSVVVRLVWRGVIQGAEPNMELTGIYTLRKGRVVFAELFWDHTEALEAVGLSEQDAHADS